jgi:amino-acid N-acetyltransferase
MVSVFPRPPEVFVKRLLAEVGLPWSDLTAAHMDQFFGCGSITALDGVVGLKLYESVALLRSLAVTANCRRRGCAPALVAQAELLARKQGVKKIYLLTTTAEHFFARLGYASVARASAPAVIQQTHEFSSLCPSSSVLMFNWLPAELK